MIKFKTLEEAIKAAEEHASSVGYVDFEGNNCSDWSGDEDVCAGWDGFDRRCECGNRRVFWDYYGDDEQGYTAFALAY